MGCRGCISPGMAESVDGYLIIPLRKRVLVSLCEATHRNRATRQKPIQCAKAGPAKVICSARGTLMISGRGRRRRRWRKRAKQAGFDALLG